MFAYLKRHGKILDVSYEENTVHVKALLEPRYVQAATEMRDKA